MSWPDGNITEGEICNGHFKDWKIKFPSGATYKGEWKEG